MSEVKREDLWLWFILGALVSGEVKEKKSFRGEKLRVEIKYNS